MRKSIFICMLAAAVVAGCIPFRLANSHQNSTSELKEGKATATRQLGKFTRVSIGNAIDAEIIFAAGHRVELEASDRDLARVQTEVNNGQLIVSSLGSGSRGPVKAKVYVEALSELNLSGASSATVRDWKADTISVFLSQASNADLEGTWNQLDAKLESASDATVRADGIKKLSVSALGASQLTLSGSAEDAMFSAEGGSTIDAEDLVAKVTKISLSGASTVQTQTTDLLTGSASGASKVVTTGDPQTSNVALSGASSLSKD